jgi:NADP-dependent 3-hydroxy acid dehydrogenase YdfG
LLGKNGADVVLAARSEGRLNDVAEMIEETHDTRTVVQKTDVRNEPDVRGMVNAAVEKFGGIDILVNNAGILRVAPSIEEISLEDYEDMMGTNVDGMFYATRAAIPHIRESEGNIIFIGSDSGQHPEPEITVYGATKWFVRGFAKNVEAREGKNGVGVTLVNPGDTRTEIEYKGELYKNVYERGQAAEPEDVAKAVVYAAQQDPRCTASTVDLYQRSLLSDTYDSLLDRD